jgi:hypothetical protein
MVGCNIIMIIDQMMVVLVVVSPFASLLGLAVVRRVRTSTKRKGGPVSKTISLSAGLNWVQPFIKQTDEKWEGRASGDGGGGLGRSLSVDC